MNRKIIITIGISNSGKSTWAHTQWDKNPLKTVIVNRDKIRELLFSYNEDTISTYYKRVDFNKLEKLVTKYEDTLINEALNENKTVIIDATHLSGDYIKRHEYWNVPIELIWFDVSLNEAIKRNSNRNRKVDVNIIEKQYNKYNNLKNNFSSYSFSPKTLNQDENLPPCLIYDIDGTIAKITDRSPYNWHRVKEDLPISNVISTINWMSEKKPKIIICTGRDGVALFDTIEWLNNNNIYWDEVHIRNSGDMRPDWIVKEEMWRKISEKNYIVGMYDDRLQVVRRARSLGLKVFNVEYNNF